MAIFEYTALSVEGRKIRGIVDADTPANARRKLRDQQLYPISVDAGAEAEGAGASSGDFRAAAERMLQSRGVPGDEIILFTRQLGVLLRAGMPLAEALESLVRQTERPAMRKVIADVNDKVRSGGSLSNAMADHRHIFSAVYTNMVYAGESSGTLEQMLARLVEIMEHDARTRKRIVSMLAYPAFLALFSVGTIVFLMMVIVPRITGLLERQGKDLPLITEALIVSTEFTGTYWYLILAIMLSLFGAWRYWVGRPEGRIAWDRFRLRMPVLGNLHVRVVSARFARVLGTLMRSGLTVIDALNVAETVLQNRYVESRLKEVKAGVRQGKNLAAPLEQSGVFPPMLIQMVDLGQRSGEMEAMLLNVAETYDEEVEVTLDTVVSLIEPAIIVVMGSFVGLLILAILLPILRMSSSLS